ncbi:MAG: LytTR family DNA-binding domain-containing protein [Nitratireductor sp.]
MSLQAQDHYVRVTTTRGSEMILIRLADAENELGTGLGERVHRSWWVAKGHASRLERSNGRMELILSNGTSVPVSRSYRKAAEFLVLPPA